MAWYKDPETGEMVKVDLFEKPDNQLSSMKSPQSTILVVPFNTPFRTMNLEGGNPEGTVGEVYGDNSFVSAVGAAQTKGPSALMRGLLPAWAWGGQGNFIAAESWFPWNMSVDPENITSLENVAFDVAQQAAGAGQFPGGFPMLKNKTRYKNSDQVDIFNPPAPSDTADGIRAKAKISYLVEKSPNGTLTTSAPHAFNTYDLQSLGSFADNNSSAWKNGLYSSLKEISTGDNNADQYKSRLLLMNESIHLKDYNVGINPVFENLKEWFKIIKYGPWEKLSAVDPDNNDALSIIAPKNYSDHSYRDATFEIKKPFLENAYQANIGEDMGLSSPVKIQGHYNFYLLPYEKAISDYPTSDNMPIKVPLGDASALDPIPESFLPNIYALMYDQISDEKYFRYSDQGSWLPPATFKYCKKENGNLYIDDPQKEIHPSAKSFLNNTLSQFLAVGTKKQDINKGPVKNIADYLNAWVLTMNTINKLKTDGENIFPAYQKYKTKLATGAQFGVFGSVKGSGFANKQKKYNVVGVSAYKMKDFVDEAAKLKKMFPFYVDIDLPMANRGYVGDVLYKAGLTDIFMQNAMAAMYTISSESPLNESAQIFYNNIKTYASTTLNETCVIRKDNQIVKGDVQPEQNTMFNETLLHLWLNEFLETDLLLDLDAAPAYQADMPAGWSNMQSHANYFAGLPPQYYDWINNEGSGADYIAQIKKLKGGVLSDDISILKPVVFGKAPPKSAGAPLSFLKWIAAKTKINKFINERVRSVKDIYQGKKAYSEVLFYEVVKYKAWTTSDVEEAPYSPGNSVGKSEEEKTGENFSYAPIGGPNPGMFNTKTKSFIQSFFIPNIPGMDTTNYIDTQVKYDKGYYYQVYAHTFVVGTQYQNKSITGPEFLFPGPWALGQGLKLEYSYKPDVHLIRVPYYNTIASANNTVYLPEEKATNYEASYFLTSLETTLVWDKPPIFPDVSFLPLSGETDKILINCNFNIGEYDLYPISLDKVLVPGTGGNEGKTHTLMNKNEETTQIKTRINQKKMKGPVTYSGDDFCGSIEILRIDKKPKSYQDFAPTNKTRIATVGEGLSNLGYIDNTLKTNKDYYYIFRETDTHGNYSNPSPVYLARIVDKDGEAPYTIFKMFFMNELQNKKANDPTKSFMKYIRIGPSMDQRVLDEDALENYKDGSVGLVASGDLNTMIGDSDLEESVWGKTFKFRFTSKKTGKKFDLNLTVKDVAKIQKENESSSGEPNIHSSGKC
jgi:hypothetical protein